MAPTNRKAHFECQICDQVCTYKYNLATHLKNFHGFEKVLFCTEKGCEEAFKTISDHGNHMKNEHQWKSQCEICGKVFKRPQNKWAHKKTHRSNEVGDAKTSAELDEHIKSHDIGKVFKFKCNVCGKGFNNRKTKWGHIQRDHSKMDLPDKPKSLKNNSKTMTNSDKNQSLIPNDDIAKIALIKFAKRNKVVPWMEQPKKRGKNLDQGVKTRSVAKKKVLFQLKSEVVEEKNTTDFLDQEDISENLEIDTSLNPEDKTKDCDKELQNENECLKSEAIFWKTKYENLLEHHLTVLAQQNKETEKLQTFSNENQTCEEIIDVELEIKEELPEILDVFSMCDQFHEK